MRIVKSYLKASLWRCPAPVSAWAISLSVSLSSSWGWGCSLGPLGHLGRVRLPEPHPLHPWAAAGWQSSCWARVSEVRSLVRPTVRKEISSYIIIVSIIYNITWSSWTGLTPFYQIYANNSPTLLFMDWFHSSSQLSNLWWMPNSVSKGFSPTTRTKTIPMILRNLSVSFKSASLCFGVWLIKVGHSWNPCSILPKIFMVWTRKCANINLPGPRAALGAPP